MGSLSTAAMALVPVLSAALSHAATAATESRDAAMDIKAEKIIQEMTDEAGIDEKAWEGRPKSKLVKWLMGVSDKSIAEVAEYIGCQSATLNNKLFRDSFTVEDIVLAAHACGFTLVLINNKTTEGNELFQLIDYKTMFQTKDPDVIARVEKLDDKERQKKADEYQRMKEQLEKMKAEYGFED